jgi:hypothetical protein
MSEFQPIPTPMSAEEVAAFKLRFIEQQILDMIDGTLGRNFLICPHCASENVAGISAWCCELMAKSANAVLDRLEQQERSRTALAVAEKLDMEPPLVVLQ